MGAIKKRISKVYAKAQDRNCMFSYKRNKRDCNAMPRLISGLTSGNASLIDNRPTVWTLYATQKFQVPEKTYNTVRLVLLNKIPSLSQNLTKDKFCFRFVKAPHQLLKYHAIASGARADRLSQGMSNAAGRAFMRGYKPKRTKENYSFLKIYFAQSHDATIKKKQMLKMMKKLLCKLPFQGFTLHEPNDQLKTVTRGQRRFRNKKRMHEIRSKTALSRKN